MRFSRQEYWSGLPFPPLGDLPNSGIEPASLESPVLAPRFFTTRATWEFFKFLLFLYSRYRHPKTTQIYIPSSTLNQAKFWRIKAVGRSPIPVCLAPQESQTDRQVRFLVFASKKSYSSCAPGLWEWLRYFKQYLIALPCFLLTQLPGMVTFPPEI